MTTMDLHEVIVSIAKDINKSFDLDIAIPGTGECMSDVKHWVPTASVMLNLLLGNENYGAPVSRIIEIFGDYSHGKSTILQILMNAWQNAGGITNLIDSESGWNRDRAIAMGHNPNRHLALEADTVETGFSIIQALNSHYKSKFSGYVPILYGWDTLTAAPTRGEKDNDEYQSGMMFKARKIREELRKLCKELPKANATLVVVSQTIEGPKKQYSSEAFGVKTTAGGGGVKFFSSQRIQVERVGIYKDPSTKKPIGIISNCKLVKNKLAPPFRNVDIPINYQQGVDTVREVYNYLLDNSSIINAAGAYKRIDGYGQSSISFYERDLSEVVTSTPGLYCWLVDQCKVCWLDQQSNGVHVNVIDPEDVEEVTEGE